MYNAKLSRHNQSEARAAVVFGLKRLVMKFKAYQTKIGGEGYMAGKEIPRIYCWKIEIDELKIYTASSERGVVRVGVSLDNTSDCVEYFKAMFPRLKIIKNRSSLLILNF